MLPILVLEMPVAFIASPFPPKFAEFGLMGSQAAGDRRCFLLSHPSGNSSVNFSFFTVVLEHPVTPGSTTAAGRREHKVERYLPISELGSFLVDQPLPVAGVRLVAD